MRHTIAIGHKSTIENGYPVATGDDGADDYIRAMMQEAQETGRSVNWNDIDAELDYQWQRAQDADSAQGGYSDWRWA